MSEIVFEDACRPGQTITVKTLPTAYEVGPRPGTTWLTLPGDDDVMVFGDPRNVRAKILAILGGLDHPAGSPAG